MTSICQASISVKASLAHRGPGQPAKRTLERVQAINRAVVQAALTGNEIPSDVVLAREHGVSERAVRDIRLGTLGLNRRELERWQQQARENPRLIVPLTVIIQPQDDQPSRPIGDANIVSRCRNVMGKL